MLLYILGETYEKRAVIDRWFSLLWVKRYFGCGEFELYIPADDRLIPYLQPDYFIIRDDDDSVMVIEKLQIQTDAENGDSFIVSGRSLESILYRRIFKSQFVLDNQGSLNGAVLAMMQECTTNHDSTPGHPYTYRQIPGLQMNFNPAYTYDGTMEVQFTGQTLLDAIVSVCQPREVGLRMNIVGSTLLLTLYKGDEVPVTFSAEFDNLINSKYLFDMSTFNNDAYIAGEGEGGARRWLHLTTAPLSDMPSGLALRELFVDARDISSNNNEITSNAYFDMLKERGMGKLAEHVVKQSFEAEIEPQMTYKYKTDWNLGDVVTVENEYGIKAKPRIIEVIECWDDTGYSVIPTFDDLEIIGKTVLRDSNGYILRDSTGAKIAIVKER